MICSIHQPNFFPYTGIWNKIKHSDKFVILSHCQFEKNNYQNRFLDEGKWYTMSVSKKTDSIRNKRYVNYQKDWNRILSHFPKLNQFNHCISESLYWTNLRVMIRIANDIGILTRKLIYDYDTDLTGTDRLIDICKKNGCTEYLSGQGGKKYLDIEKFNDAGITVYFQNHNSNKSIVRELYV